MRVDLGLGFTVRGGVSGAEKGIYKGCDRNQRWYYIIIATRFVTWVMGV